MNAGATGNAYNWKHRIFVKRARPCPTIDKSKVSWQDSMDKLDYQRIIDAMSTAEDTFVKDDADKKRIDEYFLIASLDIGNVLNN